MKMWIRVLSMLVLVACSSLNAYSQTTEFTYQGSLNDAGNTANGSYDFEFLLFDAVSDGSQIGSTLARNGVPVANGVFSVNLDFGDVFPGASRFLEVRVRPTGGGPFTQLSPRQKIYSTPYSVRSLNSAQLGGLNASGFIQNSTNQQATSNFNISGTGSANVLSAATQFNLGIDRILSVQGTQNLFVGIGAGASNTTGLQNTFFGLLAGNSNSTGGANAYFGFSAGRFNTGGFGNTFFGSTAGQNSTGSENAFFGLGTGFSTSGNRNAFFGGGAGTTNTAGSFNTFIGDGSGQPAGSGSFNLALGAAAKLSSGELTNASAIGPRAQAAQSNTLILGSINGINGATANTNIGIGTTAPIATLYVQSSINNGGETTATFRNNSIGPAMSHVHFGFNGDWYIRSAALAGKVMLQDSGGNVGIGNTGDPTYKLQVHDASNAGLRVLTNSPGGTVASFGGLGAFVVDTVSTVGGRFTVQEGGNIGIGTNSPASKFHLAGNNSNFAMTFTNSANTPGIRGYRLAFDNDRLTFQRADDSGNFAENQVAIDPATGNVGIGTISPTHKLHVVHTGGAFPAAVLVQNPTESGYAVGGAFYSSSTAGHGISGQASANTGTNYGVSGQSLSPDGWGVYAFGRLGATGAKAFRIDHPNDPANKYLQHYSSESPEVINFYRGNVTLDENGEAMIELPSYFAMINKSPSYQLTAVGKPMPTLHVAEEIDEAALRAGATMEPEMAAPKCWFRIAGGVPGAKVSWRVEAVRNDRWIQQRGAPIELEKQGREKGTYQHPEFYGKPKELGVNYDAKEMRFSDRSRPEPAKRP